MDAALTNFAPVMRLGKAMASTSITLPKSFCNSGVNRLLHIKRRSRSGDSRSHQIAANKHFVVTSSHICSGDHYVMPPRLAIFHKGVLMFQGVGLLVGELEVNGT